MGKLVSVLSFVALLSAAAVALAASPKPSHRYSGTGQDYLNNGPHWETAKSLREPLSFQISKNGKQVLMFKGRYFYYCGAGTLSITDGFVSIHRGAFQDTGHQVQRSHGKVTGTDYFALKGHFIKAGAQADVSYLANFVAKGQTQKHPYSFAFHRAGCDSRVQATVTAH